MTNRVIPPEVKALGNRFLPWESDVILRKPDGPPKGLRLSEPCGACCMLDFFLERPSVVNDGVSLEGHLKADIFIQQLLMPNTTVEVEKVYQWAAKGFSGMDCVVDTFGDGLYDDYRQSNDPYSGHYELKTSSDVKPKPKRGNREQVIRQRVVMARHYGITDAELFNSYLFIVSKEGRQTNKVHGPFLVVPTDEELEVAQRDIDLRVQVYDDLVEDGETDPYEHPLLRELRRKKCTRCFPLEKAELPPDINKVLDKGKKDWDNWVEAQRLAKWMKKVKEDVRPLVPAGKSMETDYFLIRHTEAGKFFIDPKNLK